MAAKAKEVTNGPIHVAMGGFHMTHQTKQEITAVIDRLEELGVEQVAPCHCSGDTARELFKQRFGDRCVLACVGSALPYRSER